MKKTDTIVSSMQYLAIACYRNYCQYFLNPSTEAIYGITCSMKFLTKTYNQGVACINYVIDTDCIGCTPSVFWRKKKDIC